MESWSRDKSSARSLAIHRDQVTISCSLNKEEAPEKMHDSLIFACP